MTDVLDDLAFHLDAAGILDASAIWLDTRPDQPTRILVLTRYSGAGPERSLGAGLPWATRPRIQVVARDARQTDASDLAWAAWKALEPVANQAVNGTWFERIETLQEPFLLERDETQRWLYAFNVEAIRAVT